MNYETNTVLFEALRHERPWTLEGYRQFGGYLGATAGLRVDPQFAAETPHTFFHAEQSQAAHRARVESGAVVGKGAILADGSRLVAGAVAEIGARVGPGEVIGL